MKQKWSLNVLGHTVSHKKGNAFKSDWFKNHGRPIVKVTNFTDNSISEKEIEFVDENIYNECLEFLLHKNDVVIQTVGSWPNNPASVVGKVIRVPPKFDGALLNQNAVILRPKSEIDRAFFYYLLKCENFKGHIINTAQGAANQASITLESIFRYSFYLPPPAIQKKIAAILSAYDDLIENNNRRIALLEKMAEELYREWFVRLRFPGHENAHIEYRPTRSFVDTYIGGGWGEDSQIGPEKNPVYVIRGTDFEKIISGDMSSVPTRYITDSSLHSRKVMEGDIIMENSINHKSRTAGKSILITKELLGMFNGDVICASFCKLVRPKDKKLSKYLALNFRMLFEQGIFDYYQNIATNGIANLQIERFLDRNFIPYSDAMNFDFLNSLDSSNYALSMSNLKKSRDSLLPRLISGKLSVEELDIQFPPSMQGAA